ncbi:MAG: hypothetical protein LBN33_01665 [Desulfovibrio sp.]|jgi:TolA-binding protein|nr:hypothetical protein [Desulfovibrio sp.]
MRKKNSDRALAALLLLALLLCACPLEENRAGDDLLLADKAVEEQDVGDAEMYFLRYLRKNPDGKRRWDVWQQLLSIALNIRQDNATAKDYLEIMLVEFSGDPSRRRDIAMDLALLCRDMRFYTRAAELWESLADDPDLGAEEKALAYREQAYNYLRRLEFTPAAESLDLCLKLKAGPERMADCYYALAETQLLNEDLKASETALRDLLMIEGLPEDRKSAAVFMLSEVLEMRDLPEESRLLLESIMQTYPNSKVIEVRLGALKGKKSAASPARSPRPGTEGRNPAPERRK